MADNFYTYLNDQGIIQPDTSEIMADVQDEIKSAFGTDIDLSPETPQGRLIDVLTTERAGVIGFNAANANQMNLDYATGVFLDAIGSFFGVDRIGETSTRVLATVAGTSATVITAGSVAKTTAGDEFYAENDITIPSGGSTTGYFLSSETGAIPCDTGTLTKIVSAVLGWDSIANPAAAIIGLNQESDTAYRSRIKASRYNGSGFVADIASRLNSIENIVSSFVYDNGTASPVWYDGSTVGDGGVLIPAHSIFVIADGGTDADIAQAIFETKSSGSGYTAIRADGTVTFSGTGAAGNTITVGGLVYTLRSTLAAAYDVKIGASAAATATSLYKAINASGTAGVDYYTGTLANPKATATNPSSGVVGVVSTSGNYTGGDFLAKSGTDIAVINTQNEQSVTVNIEDGDYGVIYPVTLNRPQSIPIDIAITVRSGSYAGDDLEQAVKDSILSWSAGEVDGVDGLNIGQDVSPFEIASAVSILVPAPFVTDCKIALHGGSLAATTLEIKVTQIATISEDNITVTIE